MQKSVQTNGLGDTVGHRFRITTVDGRSGRRELHDDPRDGFGRHGTITAGWQTLQLVVFDLGQSLRDGENSFADRGIHPVPYRGHACEFRNHWFNFVFFGSLTSHIIAQKKSYRTSSFTVFKVDFFRGKWASGSLCSIQIIKCLHGQKSSNKITKISTSTWIM